MANQVKVLAINCYSLSFLSGTHMVEEQNWLLQVVPSLLQAQVARAYPIK